MNLTRQMSAPKTLTELIPSVDAINPGGSFSIALHMKMPRGWHSYYLNPGESGQATSIKWRLPAGFTAGPIQWPVPKRVVINDVAGYVYEDEAWLITEIHAPKTLKVGQHVKISADVSWLLCREACFPQNSKLAIELGIKAFPQLDNPGFLKAWKSVVPPLRNTQSKAILRAGKVILSISASGAPKNGIEFFPSDPTFFGADLSEAKASASSVELTVPISKYAPRAPKEISGILVVPNGSAKGAHWVSAQVTNL
jgi:thiol:disulfide interchange protein DsbD